MWSEVKFGKWAGKGKILPQVIVSDPDWFFWAYKEGAFKGALVAEAELLSRRAKAIKLPASRIADSCVQYMIGPDGKFAGFNVIKKSQPAHVGSSREQRSLTLDLSFTRTIQNYDKLGARLLLKTFRYYWFEDKSFTKSKVETFFDNNSNFLNP
ncbi:hypothetical protein VQH23_24020 [Pararoseomonas sp. SCSIO 73927]|uniref:hypothetical protein n=1 Tax=Pararoseomonas sp. SCSIO 73927 TaxID=3114537 RepID=UPI0030D408FA